MRSLDPKSEKFPFEIEWQVVPAPVVARFESKDDAENFLDFLDHASSMEAVSYNFERGNDGKGEGTPETFLNG